MARPSRPPGFDMTYRPAETVFGPPFVVRIPSFIYLTCALAAVVVVMMAEHSAPGSFLYINILERSARGVISARTVAALLVIGAVAAIVQSGMRGVRIRGDGVEYRDMLTIGIPRLRRVRWAQIDCIVLNLPQAIAIDLWDGSRTYLPVVSDRARLSATLEQVAAARAIPVRGGAGLDEIPDKARFEDDGDE
ncbi:MAG TPA: hypothetical protein VM686_14020 [Polyangiaceae bacterium]|jgi:hypothetical protein|nr:hypothetical protein [Polyangiaceae bacterium]